MSSNEYVMKICALGAGNVGKTSLIRRYAEGKFSYTYLPTLGVDITTKRITVDTTKTKLILVDTGGQEFFGRVRASYYKGALGSLVVFALNDRTSFEAVSFWIEEFKRLVQRTVALVLVGNKKDLVNERVISNEEAKAYAEREGIEYYETSALLGGQEIEEVFVTLASEILSNVG